MDKLNMDAAIELVKREHKDYKLLPDHTTTASMLIRAVDASKFSEEQFLKCTFSVLVEGDGVSGPVVMTINESKNISEQYVLNGRKLLR